MHWICRSLGILFPIIEEALIGCQSSSNYLKLAPDIDEFGHVIIFLLKGVESVYHVSMVSLEKVTSILK